MAWFEPRPLTIPDILAANAENLRNKDAVIDGDTVWSWGRFGDGTAAIANGLLSLGLVKGDRVVILMKNSAEMVEAMFGVIRAGLVAVPLNIAINDQAVAGMIANCEARAVIASGEHIARVESLRSGFPELLQERLIGIRPEGSGWLDYTSVRAGANPILPKIDLSRDDECNIIYSSGTTGLPKGIVHDHACREAWGSDMAVALRYHSGARTLCNLGLFSNISWVAMLATFFAGGTVVVERRFEPSACLQLIEDRGITHAAMVPLQYQKLLDVDDLESYRLDSLKAYMSCGSPLAPSLKQAVVDRLPGDFIELYGLTEGLVTILGPEEMLKKIDSVGRACPGQRLAILDENDNVLGVGEPGEIVGYSRFMMSGYHDNDEANRESTWRHPDGSRWIRTGDIGMLDDDGFLVLVDRKKDMILSGGQNIFPADIEAVLIEYDAVSEVAVVGVPHEKWGETPLAVVVAQPGSNRTAEDVTLWANERLGKQQRISATVFVDELPRNPNGKVLKRELRKQFA